MPNRSPLAERIENVAFEADVQADISSRQIGSVAMPIEIKHRYHREVNSDQLVIPRYAYPENTVELDEDGRDLLA